ncbi:MAG: FadR/GntR family transcriptional regulator [Victivallaceae bacterium]|nr:FadR/GntR family transcriptional regulator [Victivallaceae bacterium]
MKIQKPQRTSLSAQIVQEMERIIGTGEWPVGGQIPPEPELMRLFGVSRNTLREALHSLIHAGLLLAKPGDGTYVKRRTRMESLLHRELAGAEPGKVLEARLALELGIVGLAAKNRTAGDLHELRLALDRRNGGDDQAADAEFHMAVARATHNPLLADFYNEICRYMLQNLVDTPLKGEMLEREIVLHEDLYRALNDADAERAKAVTREIIRIYSGRIGLGGC